MHKFELIEVSIPAKYYEILNNLYGEFHIQFPPIQERGKINYTLIVDPYTPYKQMKW